MTTAAIFLGAGLIAVALLSIKRRPKLGGFWLFITLVLLFVGVVSLGLTGSAVAFVFTPILNVMGFSSADLKTSWLGAMALSLLCPPGLVLVHGLARYNRTYYWLIFVISLLVYLLLASISVYYIVELV